MSSRVPRSAYVPEFLPFGDLDDGQWLQDVKLEAPHLGVDFPFDSPEYNLASLLGSTLAFAEQSNDGTTFDLNGDIMTFEDVRPGSESKPTSEQYGILQDVAPQTFPPCVKPETCDSSSCKTTAPPPEFADTVPLERKKPGRKPTVLNVTLQSLKIGRYFDLPLQEAAKRLGVGQTVLKRKCRELGMKRWPFRVCKSLQSLMVFTEKMLETLEVNPNVNDKTIAHLRAELERVTNYGLKLSTDVKDFRQFMFKLAHRAARYGGSGRQAAPPPQAPPPHLARPRSRRPRAARC